jgi:hypothetical protein
MLILKISGDNKYILSFQDNKTILYQKIFPCRDLGKELGGGEIYTYFMYDSYALLNCKRICFNIYHPLIKDR